VTVHGHAHTRSYIRRQGEATSVEILHLADHGSQSGIIGGVHLPLFRSMSVLSCPVLSCCFFTPRWSQGNVCVGDGLCTLWVVFVGSIATSLAAPLPRSRYFLTGTPRNMWAGKGGHPPVIFVDLMAIHIHTRGIFTRLWTWSSGCTSQIHLSIMRAGAVSKLGEERILSRGPVKSPALCWMEGLPRIPVNGSEHLMMYGRESLKSGQLPVCPTVPL
jgi:hypothetical protein